MFSQVISFYFCGNKMGCLSSKPTNVEEKYNQNHRKKKMFAIGLTIEKGEFNTDVRTYIGYSSTTVKRYDKAGIEIPVHRLRLR
jgi:hypothetical protein